MRNGKVVLTIVALGALAQLASACGSSDQAGAPASSPCSEIAVSRFQELVVVDEQVVADARSSNASGGPWSFRHLVEQMAPDGKDPSDFVMAWFNEWMTKQSVNNFSTAPRPEAMTRFLCPWLEQTSSNQCNAGCTTCAAYHLDLKLAPFRLMAITNRMDLREQADIGGAGEGRLLFAGTAGPGDDPASKPLHLSVIFEYHAPSQNAQTAKFWADRWHHLGTFAGFTEEYRQELETVTRLFTERSAAPSKPNGSAIGQVRTNEDEFDGWTWHLREFQLGADGVLHSGTTRNTPPDSLNGSAALADFISQNHDAVLAGNAVVPTSLLGGEALRTSRWTLPPERSEEVGRNAFAKATCNGCHLGQETGAPALDENFQVSPFKKGLERLSTFINNPADPAHDDLANRTVSMQKALCGL